MQKIKVKGQLFQKIEWKQTDGRTDMADRITFPTNAVGKIRMFVLLNSGLFSVSRMQNSTQITEELRTIRSTTDVFTIHTDGKGDWGVYPMNWSDNIQYASCRKRLRESRAASPLPTSQRVWGALRPGH